MTAHSTQQNAAAVVVVLALNIWRRVKGHGSPSGPVAVPLPPVKTKQSIQQFFTKGSNE